jgi:hypothetical protein
MKPADLCFHVEAQIASGDGDGDAAYDLCSDPGSKARPTGLLVPPEPEPLGRTPGT